MKAGDPLLCEAYWMKKHELDYRQNAAGDTLAWICGTCHMPTFGGKWKCDHCGAEAGGVSEGDAFWLEAGVMMVWDERRVSGAANIFFRPFQIVSRESIIESCKRQSKEDAAIFHAVWMAGTPEGVMALWDEGRVTDAGSGSQDVL